MSQLMYSKLPMYLFFYLALGLNDFDGGQNGLASLVAISGPKEVEIFIAHPFQWPSKMICLHQNYYVPRHINNRYINS
jgi:hypothetical protein